MDYETMQYRNLGPSGLKISVLSFGTMIWREKQSAEVEEQHFQMFDQCYRRGINFIDSAQSYGQSEQEIGRFLSRNEWDRDELIISTKVFPTTVYQPDSTWQKQGLSRKSVAHGIDKTLQNLQTDFVDILYCHAPEYNTRPLELCRAMNKLIDDEKVLYWGTSNFETQHIAEIFSVCDQYGLEPPIVEQCEYNMVVREAVEAKHVPLYQTYGYGITTWSPLCSGLLTGKYNNGMTPDGSRLSALKDTPVGQQKWELIFADEQKGIQMLQSLHQIAEELGITQAQLALAWVIQNKDVSTCLAGANSLEQVENNLQAVDAVKLLTPEVLERIEEILGNRPKQPMNYKTWQEFPPRR